MNPIIVCRLVQPRLWVILTLILATQFATAVTPIKHPKDFLILLIPTVALGAVLASTATAALSRPGMALLPGLEKLLLQTNVVIAVTFGTIWAILIGTHIPAETLWAKIAISVGGATAALPLGAQQKEDRRVTLFMIMLAFIFSGGHFESGFFRQVFALFLEHSAITGSAAAALAAWSISRALDRRRLRRLEITHPTDPSLIEERGFFGRRMAARPAVYRLRHFSTRSLAATIAEEWPRPGFKWAVVAVGALILLIIPKYAGGLRTGWWEFAFGLNGKAASPGALFVSVGIVVMGTFAPRLRAYHVYPVSRRRRATADLLGTLHSWGVLFLCWILLPVGVGAVVGLSQGLPLDFSIAFGHFILPALVAFPALVILRCGVLFLENRNEVAMITTVVLTLIGLIIGWIAMLNASLSGALKLIAFLSVVAAAALCAAIFRFYRESDLTWPVQRRVSSETTFLSS